MSVERLIVPDAVNTLLENGLSQDDAEAALKVGGVMLRCACLRALVPGRGGSHRA